MTCALDGNELRGSWNELQRNLQFHGRAKSIGSSADKQTRRSQFRKMRCPQLFGLVGRMQGVGQQQETRRQFRFFSSKHAGLAASVGMTCEVQPPGGKFLEQRKSFSQTLSIPSGGGGKRRPFGALLPKFEIAAKHDQSRLGEGIGDGNQEWSGAIASGPMRQNDPL